MGLKEDMDKAVCMAGKMEFEYKLREVIRMLMLQPQVEYSSLASAQSEDPRSLSL